MTDEEQKAWDMFAAAALQSLVVSHASISMEDLRYHLQKTTEIPYEKYYDEIYLRGLMSVKYADAMMEQRKARMR